MSFTTDLYKVMQPEFYKGVPIIWVSGSYMYGIRSFATIEEFKKFIDTIKK